MRGFGSTLGLYRPGSGFLYRSPLWIKALASLGCACAVVAARSPLVTGVVLVLAVASLALGARCSPARILGMLVPALPVLTVLALYQGFTQGWVRAFVVVGGITACLLAARALTLTTPVPVLLDGVVKLVRPLRVLGADPERFALTLAIMLRSIPYLVGSVLDLRDAARARGLERNPRVLVTPLVIGAVAYAHRTGEALAARGLGEHRSVETAGADDDDDGREAVTATDADAGHLSTGTCTHAEGRPGRSRNRPSRSLGQMLNPRARIWSRPSSVIFSGPHGGIHTQFNRHSSTTPSSA